MDRNHSFHKEKAHIQCIIVGKYHRENGVPGYHLMRVYLRNEGSIARSALIDHHYMMELNLCSLVRRKNPYYIKG